MAAAFVARMRWVALHPNQTKVLRALQEGEVLRVGESQLRRVDVRVVAATNRDLGEAVAQCLFRGDLL
jgi:anaerobic nitric oxide reductase transcription regulator